MEEFESFINTLVTPLVSQPEEIKIEMVETDEFYDYHLSVHPDDVGRVIGKKGRIAKAMRTILYSIQIDAPKRVRLTIDD